MWLRIGDTTSNLDQVNNITKFSHAVVLSYTNGGMSQINPDDYNMDIDILYTRILCELENCKVVNL